MHDITWIATTQTSQWQSNDAVTTSLASESKWDVEAQLDKPLQTIDGFGACFNELGWTSLSALADEDREAIFRELFAPGVGLNFNICRCPWVLTIFRETGILTTRHLKTSPWRISVSQTISKLSFHLSKMRSGTSQS